MQHSSLLLISFFCSNVLFCQEWKLEREIQLPANPTAYSVDIKNNFYLGFDDGTMLKFDSKGNQLLNYSLPNQSSITLIEAQNALKTFLFCFDNQQIITLDRFNTVPKIYNLADYETNLGLSACPSPDENFWIIENNPMRIKKIDPLRQVTILEVQVNLGDSIRFMKAHKNLLLILSENGLHIFDLFGSKISHIEVDASYFQVKDNTILLVSEESLLTIDPFQGTIEKEQNIPLENTLVILRTGNYYLFSNKNNLFIYQ